VYYYKARVYDPGMGKFYQTDPIGYGDDANWYNYGFGDPINVIDPSGLDAVTTVDGVGITAKKKPDNPPPGIIVTVSGGNPGMAVTSGDVTRVDELVLTLHKLTKSALLSNAPQSNFKLPPCGNGTAAKIADWADKISVGTGAVAVTSGALGLITAPSGAGFVGFEAVAALSGGASALASGVGVVAHFVNGDYFGAALDAGGIIGGFAAGKLAGGAIASTRTFNNLTASQARQVNLLNNATGTTIGATSSLYSCNR
jgi:hypothetical protein